MIYLIGIVITSFLLIILLTKKGKSLADKILFSWLCVILVQLILFSIISSNHYLEFPYLLGLEIPFPLLHGPFLFLYTSVLTTGHFGKPKIYLHFLPYFLAFIATIPFISLSLEEKILVYQNEGEGFETVSTLIFVGIILSGITYTILSLRALAIHKKRIKDNFSSLEKINLQWLFRLVIGLACIWVLAFFADDEIIFSSVVLFVVFIGFYGIKQVGIFTNPQAFEFSSTIGSNKSAELPHAQPENSKYEKSTLTDRQLRTIHAELVHVMKQKKLFLTPELTLTMHAEELETHPNTLSQVINSIEQKNFFDYVNTLRIEEFKERIAIPDNQKFTLLSLAFACGFNSKTSFNRNFKNLTGKSPSEYLKENKAMLE
ncbi:helix-turn-helix domain-containing protein [Algoriphagus halophytocola]|uniref:Helix-turn-helix domain-containing protein n=1 Tax=Algoriphagus halophytocola TaxID=2991499 RepID=A0ABY6MK87_9BACT|nr:helix-turn-helix domain-containing protein [Algoriphagus sp. TR-M5]UZD24192.1 helix-turn-helix domain-containing protein [Algoriphagus sp. TR-M5]